MSTVADAVQAMPAEVLVVDDSAIGRSKMRMAVRSLGHHADVVGDGAKALVLLRQNQYDAVLLDILMPGLDGFEVLQALKADDELRDVPVIIVSALDEEMESVVRGIELGAEDFLPKDFDPVLLNARLEASLTKKRYRDQDREYMRRVVKLTEAAEIMESGDFTPDDLDLDNMAQGTDPLSRLADVFKTMASEIYRRELRLKRAVQSLAGMVLVILTGVVWGVMPSLSRMAAIAGADPVGMAVWVNAFAGFICLAVAAHRNRLPGIGRDEIIFFLAWSVVAGVLQRITIFFVAGHVEASTMALIVALQSFIVFVFAALARTEVVSLRRLAGLFAGLLGVGYVLSTRMQATNAAGDFWLLICLLLPVLYAVEWLVLSRRPQQLDIFGSVAVMMLTSAAMLAVYCLLQGNVGALLPHSGRIGLFFGLMGLAAGGSVVLALHLVASTGAVYASLSAYAMTIAGIVWGVLLLGEAVGLYAWIGVTLVMIGLYLVGPKSDGDRINMGRLFSARQAG